MNQWEVLKTLKKTGASKDVHLTRQIKLLKINLRLHSLQVFAHLLVDLFEQHSLSPALVAIFSPAKATEENHMVTIKPAVRPTAISTRTINIKLRLLNKSSDGKPVKLTTARPKIKDITTRMGVGRPHTK